MEFFAEIEKHGVDIETVRTLLAIPALPDICRSIDSVTAKNNNLGVICCVWGQFDISREVIRNGVRFALLDCPHAFAWTITYHEDRNMLLIHCTINDQEVDVDFSESIEEFVSDWGIGLSSALSGNI